MEKHSDCKFCHRINPDVKGFNIFFEIIKIQNYITKSKEEKLKGKFAKELLSFIPTFLSHQNTLPILSKRYCLPYQNG